MRPPPTLLLPWAHGPDKAATAGEGGGAGRIRGTGARRTRTWVGSAQARPSALDPSCVCRCPPRGRFAYPGYMEPCALLDRQRRSSAAVRCPLPGSKGGGCGPRGSGDGAGGHGGQRVLHHSALGHASAPNAPASMAHGPAKAATAGEGGRGPPPGSACRTRYVARFCPVRPLRPGSFMRASVAAPGCAPLTRATWSRGAMPVARK